jgi:cell surface protein SprA
VLAVAFQYTIGNNIFQVGELSTTGPTAPDVLFVKLLKGTNFSPKLPNWDLMMKNIYAIGGLSDEPK